jgi:hypothetical protein
MTILRISHSKNYTCISNQAIQDERLSFRARGVHHLLLSYPDKWRVNRNHLASKSDVEGRDAIGTCLQELEALGYIERKRFRDSKTGGFVWESVVYELPIDGFSVDGQNDEKPSVDYDSEEEPIDGFPVDGEPQTEIPWTENPVTENPWTENPVTENPWTENPFLISNEITITDQANTNTKAGELKNLFSKPTERSQQSSPTKVEVKHPSPDQASKRSAQTTSSAAAPLAVENQNHPTIKTEVRFATKGHKYPTLCIAGLGHVWVGPGWTDFLPELIEACSRYLRSIEKPCERGNGINYLKNLIRSEDWAAIELRLESMDEYLIKRQKNQSTVNHPVKPPEGFEGNPGTYRYHSDRNAPKAFVDMTPAEQAEYKAAIARMKKRVEGADSGLVNIADAIATASLAEVA